MSLKLNNTDHPGAWDVLDERGDRVAIITDRGLAERLVRLLNKGCKP